MSESTAGTCRYCGEPARRGGLCGSDACRRAHGRKLLRDIAGVYEAEADRVERVDAAMPGFYRVGSVPLTVARWRSTAAEIRAAGEETCG